MKYLGSYLNQKAGFRILVQVKLEGDPEQPLINITIL